MNAEDISNLFATSPALQILRLRNAVWILPFLYTVFKEQTNTVIQEERLVQLLKETLDSQQNIDEDWEEAKISFGEDEDSRSRKHIINWVQKRILQDFPDTDGNIQYQLSAYTEKIFQWMLTLQQRQFVGTESRFKLLFTSLRDMVENSEDDRVKRLEILKNKKAEIEKEIKALELGVQVMRYNDEQVQERLELFTRLCYELISDFREVEDNFKQIHRVIVEQHTKAENNKGAILGIAFEAYDALRNSQQGRSFYSFWDFLSSRVGQEDWKKLTEELINLLESREINADTNFLREAKFLLLRQGRIVYDANDRMADKLSRIITEKEIARHRRLRQQINSIKDLAFTLMEDEDIPCGITIDLPAEVKMVMDRKLQLNQKKTEQVLKQPVEAEKHVLDAERLAGFLNSSFVDRKKLWQNVEHVLAKKQTATLKEIVDEMPLENGLAEVVGYFGFLKDKPSKVQVINNTTEHIALNLEQTKFVEVPYLLFSK
jgi:hypothetical protein